MNTLCSLHAQADLPKKLFLLGKKHRAFTMKKRKSKFSATKGHLLIRSLQIENFRCFKKVEVSDICRFAVITGSNGSGKTALLESIFVTGGGSPELHLRIGTWRGSGEISPSMFEDCFHQFNLENELRITFQDSRGDGRKMRVRLESKKTLNIPLGSEIPKSDQPKELSFSWETPAGESEGRVEITQKGLEIPIITEDVYPMLFVNSVTVLSSEKNARRFSRIAKRNEEESIKKAVKELFPSVKDLSIQTDSDRPAIYAQVSGVNQKMNIGLVSAGINKFIAILVAIKNSQGGVVLVDEIENGLYYEIFPQMWEQLINQCKEHDVQLLVTTHSKEFLNSIAPLVEKHKEDFCLLRTRKKNGEASISRFSGKEFTAAIASGFEVR